MKKFIRKFISSLIALTMVLGLSSLAFAQSNPPVLAEKNIAVLTDSEGRSTSVEVTLVDNIMLYDGSGIATYAVPLYMQDKELALTQSDGAAAARVTLTLYYSQDSDVVLLNKVGAKWTITAPSVTASNCNILAACSGVIDLVEQNKSFTDVSNGSIKSTGFKKSVHTNAGGTLVGASLNMKFHMGATREWSLSMQNNLVDTSM